MRFLFCYFWSALAKAGVACFGPSRVKGVNTKRKRSRIDTGEISVG